MLLPTEPLRPDISLANFTGHIMCYLHSLVNLLDIPERAGVYAASFHVSTLDSRSLVGHVP
jgi:hypothetical protein